MSLLAELQRRSVFKVAAAYLVVGWLVVQAASIAFPAFEASPALMRGFILLVLLGFPIALVLAWAFEMTPEGVKVDTSGAGTKRVFLIAGIVAVLSVGWYYRADIPNVGGDSGARRLAVLPLANFSPDPNNAFYADGLHDDLLTALSALPGVELVSRTTMQTFKGSPKKLAEIAQEIGATQVLEGSVRRDATTVRLTVQLIDARTDDHLWAQTFERPIAQAMTLQNEVAQGVAKTMGLALASAPDAAPPTSVPAAYDLYLKARLSGRGTALQLLDAALLLDPGYATARAQRAVVACYVLWFDDRQAAVLAPQAKSDIERARKDRPGLALTEAADAVYSYYVDQDKPTALAKVGRVLERDPNNVEAWQARSSITRRLGRMDESIAAAERGLELDPGNPNMVWMLSNVYGSYGRFRDAIAVWDRFLAALPEGSPDRDRFSINRADALYNLTGDVQPVLQAIEKLSGSDDRGDYYHILKGPSPERIARWMSPDREWQIRTDKFIAPWAVFAARDAEALGDAAARDEALAKAERLYATLSAEVLARPTVAVTHATIPALRGDAATARRMVEQALAGSPPAKDVLYARFVRGEAAIVLALIGDSASALDLLDESYANRDGYLFEYIYIDANLRQRLGNEPRYQALIKKFEAGFEKP